MGDFFQDLRFGFRMLAKSPAVTAVAVLSLALGIGANTTVFTLVNAVFLHPVPVEEPSRIVLAFTTDSGQQSVFGNLLPISWPNFRDFRDRNKTLSGMAATFAGPSGVTLTGDGDARVLTAQLVTGNYFDVLGVSAFKGRTFRPEEDASPGSGPVAVLSHGLWKREFGADEQIVGRTLTLNGYGFTVIGVAPPNFKGLQTVGDPDLMWIPLMMYRQVLPPFLHEYLDKDERRPLLLAGFGRLRDGVSLAQAQDELEAVAKHLEEQFPIDNQNRGVALTPFSPLNPNQAQQFTLAGTVLLAAVGLVLLIACANVASLLLARASGRQSEIGIRLALGAPRRRLVSQLLTESVLLGLIGGALGLVFALWGRQLLWSLRPPFLGENSISLDLDLTVLGFTALISLLTGVLFGLYPALQASKPNLTEALYEAGRGGAARGAQHRMRSGLVVAQVALALVALIGAGLFLRSMGKAQKIDPGFEIDRLAVLNVDPIGAGYDADRAGQFYDRVLERVSQIGGVESAALGSGPPPAPVFMRTTFPEGRPRDDKRSGILTLTAIVSPGYFQTAGIGLVSGRDFTSFDDRDSPPVAVVNQAAVRQFWPDEDPVGRRFGFFGEEFSIEVAGVVQDALVQIGQPAQAIIFMPLKQRFQGQMTVTLRARGNPDSVLGDAQTVIREMEPNLAVTGVSTMADLYEQQLWASRTGAVLLGVFGALALVLTLVGIYGVMSYAVNERSHEIAIRMALGASEGRVLGMVLRQGMLLVALGLGAGLAVALLATRGLSSLLYEISATDPLTFLVVPALLAAVALAANLVPARRVTRVDPVVALRRE